MASNALWFTVDRRTDREGTLVSGRATSQARRSLLAATILAAAVATTGAPLAVAAPPDFNDPVPSRPDRYFNGLEPGAVLGGVTLPVDWSQRESPCPSDPDAAHLQHRVAPSMRPPLCFGDQSEAVIYLQQLLAEKKLYRAEISGVFDVQTQFAVYAFHKLTGPAHTDPRTAGAEWRANPPPGDWTVQDWAMLEDFEPLPPKLRLGQPDRVETDIGHQVLYLIENDRVEAIIPVSTGRGPGERGCMPYGCGAFATPRTELLPEGSTFYTAHTYNGGWGGLYRIYKAIFYTGQYGEWYYALHGYPLVPNYPASGGCTRMPVWDMDFLRPTGLADDPDARIYLGMVIHVWDA